MAYRQVLEDLISSCSNDLEIVDEVRVATETGYLRTESLEPAVAARITNAIRELTAGILAGKIRSCIHDKPYGDAQRAGEYGKGLQMLVEAIPSRE
jgi:hypothetical protein